MTVRQQINGQSHARLYVLRVSTQISLAPRVPNLLTICSTRRKCILINKCDSVIINAVAS